MLQTARAYHILEADSLQNLEKEVRDTFQNDYVPIGGVSVVQTDDGLKFYQAVILYHDDE